MQTSRKKFLILAAIVGSLFLWSSMVFCAQFQTKTITSTIAQKVKTQNSSAYGTPEQDAGTFSTMSIIVSDRRYNIIQSTRLFIGPKDQQLSMEALPVPCQAEITYQLTGNDPNILQIKVLKILPGSSTSWSEPQPD